MTSPPRYTLFRPCIDIHQGLVKQIVGGTLRDEADSSVLTNFVASHPPTYYAELYRSHNLTGAHVIKLGGGDVNDAAATEALSAWKDGLQIGGGINGTNAKEWIAKGASKVSAWKVVNGVRLGGISAHSVIVTSYLFPNCTFSLERLQELEAAVGKDRLVVDVSCRKKGDKWIVAMNRWQDLTDMEVNKESLDLLSHHCSEFLIHAADVEGLCKGIDEALVEKLGEWTTIPTTYAGGARHIADLELVNRLSGGKVDLTFGSALDIFGGKGITLDELVAWNLRGGQTATS